MARNALSRVLFAGALLLTSALPGLAQDGQGWGSAGSIQQQIVSRLDAQGFEVVEIQRTLLGRFQFFAVRGDSIREVVVSGSTGEILRDVTLDGVGRNSPSEASRYSSDVIVTR
ncbi:hypothetical protein HKCCE4037_04735 [Rhodobacterales bacterium HKCCE4037]|nr:hypothetical protein [Rhodobacterales bacterium HKCCE4037]